MKRIKKAISLITLLLLAVMLTGCLTVDMKVNKNGSVDMTYTIDTSQTQGMMSFKDIEKAIEESVDGMNATDDKKIAKLKSVKENKNKETVTAITRWATALSLEQLKLIVRIKVRGLTIWLIQKIKT